MNEMETFIKSIQELLNIPDEALTDDTLKVILENIKQQFSEAQIATSVNQIVNNLEMENITKEEARNVVEVLISTIKEMAYGEQTVTGNKKILIDTVLNSMFDIFYKALDKYHTYAIELPMVLDAGAKVPTYAHDSDAAADLYALEDVYLEGGNKGIKIRTGVKIQLPEGWLALIIPRSSIGAKTPLRLSNSVGLIDSGYRGELGVLYDNISDDPYEIKAGDRIAQLLVMPSYRFQPKVVDVLASSDRGETGFGDSGK